MTPRPVHWRWYSEPSRFPDPRSAPERDPLAWGGDLDVPTMLDAYAHGIFPWPVGAGVPLWWSPDPRAVIPLDRGVHVSRSLGRTLRSGRFTLTRDQAFAEVVAACADRPGEGTWIVPDLAVVYMDLHALGLAHSVEAWRGGTLVGGVFGITLGGMFAGESMFHRASDASKVALVALGEHLRASGFVLFDVQVPTPHLASMGALSIARDRFLSQLEHALDRDCRF